MYAVVGLTEQDVECEFVSFTVLKEHDNVDDALRSYNVAVENFPECDFGLVEIFHRDVLRVVACNSMDFHVYLLENFVETANDNFNNINIDDLVED